MPWTQNLLTLLQLEKQRRLEAIQLANAERKRQEEQTQKQAEKEQS